MTSKENSTLSKKDLRQIFWRSFPIDLSFNYERQMNLGWGFMMYPTLKKIYKDDREKELDAYKRHLEFFCTNGNFAPFIGGIVASMEEQNSKTKGFDVESITALKTALMGPLAGIGDSVFLGALRVIAIAIGTSLAAQGSILGPILFWLIYNIPQFIVKYVGVMKGYELGAGYLEKIQKSGLMDTFMTAAGILGCMVVGGMIFSTISINVPLQIGGTAEDPVILQNVLNDIMPGLLSLGLTVGCYKLLKKNVNMLLILGVLVVVGILGAYLGVLS